MTFLICPRWRKERPASPSQVRDAYQGPRTEGNAIPQSQNGSAAFRNTSHSEKKQPESLSRILRRHFSRESRASSFSRDHGKFVFPFSFRPSRTVPSRPKPDLTALENYGSSLMSERGYDSDAQCITTPRRADLLGRSPASRALRRIELSDLIEQSQERSEAERWAQANNRNVSESQESAFGLHFIPTPPSTLRGPPTAFHTALNSDDSRLQQPASLKDERPQADPVTNPNFVRSLPSLSSTHLEPSVSHSEHSPVLNVSETNNGRDLMTDWKQFLKTSRERYGLGYPGSSGSLPGPSTNIVVSKTRQPSNSARSFTDPRSVHLSELGISNRLASHSQSSQVISCSPSMIDLLRKNKPTLPMGSSNENIQLRPQADHSTLSVNQTPNQVIDQRDASSCYSQQSPSSGKGSLGVHSLKKIPNIVINKPPDMKMTFSSESGSVDIPAPRHTLMSRFQEHCDSDDSSTPQFQSPLTGHVSTRKVSIGWMSGGRRVGYGYNLVPGKEANSPKKYEQTSPSPQVSQVPAVKAEFTKLNDPRGLSQSHVRLEKVRQTSARQYEASPATEYSNHLGNEPATIPMSIKSGRSNAGYSVPAYVRAILNRSSQDQGSINGLVEESERNLRAPELTATVQQEYCQVPQSSHYTTQGQGIDTFARQWASLSRAANATARKQKADLEAVSHREALQDGAFSIPRSYEAEPEYLGANYHCEYEDQTHELQPNRSRAARWARRFSRYRESRRVSNVHQKEQSQGSSGPYQDCDSASASMKRAVSTKSNTTDDPDCLEMPGSFEGSRWASRMSRML
ncbi:hypothetical protein N7456_001882 [Penicillium angulare]|uniref:Uncharacterized protein n=1 Tax=Penicillium angulare TaxID=116970 RepID=A0A9W9G784_9EURO|nr:hypothetical protein N7456_001882 [Penicillium angulare]